MLFGGEGGDLELRRAGDGSSTLKGSFPYGKTATLSDGGRNGRPRKERFAPHAFAYRVNDPTKEIHLLVGHDYGQPLASKLTGTLTFEDTAAALIFGAIITRDVAETSFGADVLRLVAAGLIYGISVGFRTPPKRAVEKVETIEHEPDDGTLDENGDPRRGAVIRTVHSALLYEVSLVVRPAYKQSQVEARDWTPTEPDDTGLRRTLQRWRA
ncbi:hypothetical protein AUC71_03115 [Methyloceanibacter marginalis]|uniref:Prohead serine protease domain-containing protein n=1 Tax=Methyloceanibacter marginalis TaxID=1774971 RepID=A0A1E3W6W2_9HYPH|nr:HK97 family phage prohead protease [Methyloceanibacter marginalis]ODS01543.1 hypothetical protein AUC71_03115 [Methyloceanibacter marginalis]